MAVSVRDVRSLIRQATDKQSTSREARLEACNELKRIIDITVSVENLPCDWKELAGSMRDILRHKGASLQVKKAVGRVLASLGGLLSLQFQSFLVFIEEAYREASMTEDSRGVLASALASAVDAHVARGVALSDPDSIWLTERCVKLLDENESATVIPYLLDLALAIAQNYPYFYDFLPDVVDVTVGWLMEDGTDSVPTTVIDKCRSTLLSLDWTNEMAFSSQLSKTFLSDVSKCLLAMSRNEGDSRAENARKCRSIMGVLCLLIHIWERIIEQNDTIIVAISYIEFTLQECVRLAYETYERCRFRSAAISALYASYLDVMCAGVSIVSPACVLHVFSAVVDLSALSAKSQKLSMSTLQFYVKLARSPYCASIPWQLVFCDGSFLCTVPSNLSSMALYTDLLTAVLDPGCLPVLLTAYPIVLSFMHTALDSLKKKEEIRSNTVKLLATLSSMRAIMTMKNSLIVMHGLDPPLFELLFGDLLKQEWLIDAMPAALHAILHMAYLHCSSHEFYVSTSVWLSSTTATSATHSVVQLVTLTKLIEDVAWPSSRKLISKWLCEIVLRVGPPAVCRLSALPEWVALRRTLLALPIDGLTKELSEMCEAVGWTRTSGGCAEYAVRVRKALDTGWDEQTEKWEKVHSSSLIRSFLDTAPFAGEEASVENPWSSPPFEMVMGFLLNSSVPVLNANGDEQEKNDKWICSVLDPLFHDDELAMRWRLAISSTANHIVDSRLKTSLGGAQETLVAIQNAVMRLAREGVGREKNVSPLCRPLDWLRVRLLLDLLDLLDKHMFTAYGGTVFSLYNPSPATRTFFSLNQGQCTEWMARLLPSAMAVAHLASAHTHVVLLGWRVLDSVDKNASTPSTVVLTAIGWLARSFVQLQCGLSVEGLRVWSTRQWNQLDWEWLKGAERVAAGRYEDGLDCLSSFLSSHSDGPFLITIRSIMTWAICQSRISEVKWEESLDKEAIERCRALGGFGADADTAPWWSAAELADDTECRLMQVNKRAQAVAARRGLADAARIVFLFDTDRTVALRMETLTQIAKAVQTKMDRGNIDTMIELIDPSRFCSPSVSMGNRVGTVGVFSQWADRLGVPLDPRSHLHIAKLLRRSGNERKMREHLAKGVQQLSEGTQALLTFVQQTKICNKQDMDRKSEMLRRMGCSFASLCDESIPPAEAAIVSDALSRCCLRVSEWAADLDALRESIQGTKLAAEVNMHISDLGVDAAGAFLRLAVILTPQLSKAHREFGLFCERAADEISVADELATATDVLHVHGVSAAITSSHSLAQLEKNIRDAVGGDDDLVERVMMPNSPFLSIWMGVQDRRGLLLSHSLSAYLAFLSQIGGDGIRGVDSVSTSLSILKILVEYHYIPCVIPLVESGLRSTNEYLWMDVLPQLFARLSHPARALRAVIVDLLVRIGNVSPHSIAYQVIVGARSHSWDTETGLLEEEEEAIVHSKERNTVFDCCRSIEDVLADKFPALVNDVRMFVAQLAMLNLIEERWSFVLTHLDSGMARRMKTIEVEEARTNRAVHLSPHIRLSLIHNKRQLIFSPVYHLLDDLRMETMEEAKRNEHTKRFLELYGNEIEVAFAQSSAIRGTDPEMEWMPFKKLCASFAQRACHRGGHPLDLSPITPSLLSVRGSSIPLPGQDSVPFQDVVFLHQVHSNVAILPTKTKPKKITFTGTDGKHHVFLLKSHEDMHLDERIMQLLRMCNLVLGGRSARETVPYMARHYAVTPLGQLSGLIQWVEGAIPLYRIYRKWHQREYLKQNKHEENDVFRPMEMFQKKLKAELEANGLASKLTRRDWPSNVLLSVFKQLEEQTPRDLISRELWMRSGGPSVWWNTVLRFSRSTAVMSMIGWILGLGDRHLDNLLLDTRSGDIVHIDYNICFEKGRNLRVPETVPFRLTQNIVAALGPTRTDGVFHGSCVHVLSVLRENTALFSSILSAFLFDPLLDWTTSDHYSSVTPTLRFLVYGTNIRLQEENPIRKMFAIRMNEISHEWIKNKEEMASRLDTLMDRHRRGDDVRDELAGHHKLFAHIQPLVKALANSDERFSLYWSTYRKKLTEPWKRISRILTEQMPTLLLKHHVNVIQSSLDEIFDGLLLLKDEESVNEVSAPPPGLDIDSINIHEDVNPFARGVVRKVTSKLEGRAEGGGSARNAEEQVDALIEQATSASSLSVMYEGWTAWV